MANSNPAFANSPAFKEGRGAMAPALTAEQLDELYNRPAATPSDTERMTYQDTVVKTVVSFGILLVGAAIGWAVPVLALPAAIVGFVLALVNIFKKKPSAALTLAYAAVQGVFVGGISVIFESRFPGVVGQATIATLAVVGVTLALFASGKVRASARATKVFLIAMVGYAVFSLINVGLMVFGANTDPWGLRGYEIFGIPLGLPLGILAVLLGAYSLVLDFDSIKTGVTRGAPRAFAWQAAFGIMVSVVWLYVEILRLLAILRGNN